MDVPTQYLCLEDSVPAIEYGLLAAFCIAVAIVVAAQSFGQFYLH